MITHLLDTDVVSQVSHPNVAAWLKTVDDHQLAISVFTVQEMWKGVARAQKKGLDAGGSLAGAVQGVMDAFQGRILSLDAEPAKQWGLLVGQQEKNINDKGIVMIAAAHGLVLVSRNVKHVVGLGVDVLDPFPKTPKLYKAG